MRVLSGSARGIPLKTVPDMDTRPILDRIKKSLFSILESAVLIGDARMADLYAGTGTQGIEALSRGAEFCLFVEKRPDAVALIKENLAKTRLDTRAQIRRGNAGDVLESLTREISPSPCGRGLGGGANTETEHRFDLILYDPPFSFSRESGTRAALESEMALAGTLLFPKHARIVLRFEKKNDPPEPMGLKLYRHWTDGPHAFAFYGLGE